MSMTQATVPNADATRDHGFLLDTGETVVVRVERAPQQPNGDAIAIRVQARMVDPLTGDTLLVGTEPVQSDAHVATVLSGALADGSITLASIVSGRMATEALRPRAYKAALTSFMAIATATQ